MPEFGNSHTARQTDRLQLWCDLLQKLAIHTVAIRLAFPVWQQYFWETSEGRRKKTVKLISQTIFFKIHRLWNFHCAKLFSMRDKKSRKNMSCPAQWVFMCVKIILYLSMLILFWIALYWQIIILTKDYLNSHHSRVRLLKETQI